MTCDVDKSEVKGAHLIGNQVFGSISTKELSGKIKTLTLMVFYYDSYNGVVCVETVRRNETTVMDML